MLQNPALFGDLLMRWGGGQVVHCLDVLRRWNQRVKSLLHQWNPHRKQGLAEAYVLLSKDGGYHRHD